MKNTESLLKTAIDRRQKMAIASNAMRLVNGIGDGMDGLLIDRFHQHFHVQFLDQRWQAQTEAIARYLVQAFSVEYLIIKTRQGLDVTQEVLIGQAPVTIVEENGVKFEVHLQDGLNCGLFLDMRQNRQKIAEFARGKKLLNTFAYTCSFGVQARAQGAKEVVNTDISRKILDRGKINYQINALTEGPGEFIKTDSVSFLQRAFKKGNTFDVIVLDPPSFARHEGKVFQVKRDLPKAMALAMAVLNPGGALLVTTNYSEITHADLERMMARGLNGRKVKHLERVGQDKDFVGSNTFKESYLVGLWAKFL